MGTGKDGRELGYDKKERFRRDKIKTVKESKEKRPRKECVEREERRERRIKLMYENVMYTF
jgi:hypothetical protein